MKPLAWALVLPWVLIYFARADSIPTLNVSQVAYEFEANGGGDNQGYSLVGPGINLHGVRRLAKFVLRQLNHLAIRTQSCRMELDVLLHCASDQHFP
jgi:hypothetical protein